MGSGISSGEGLVDLGGLDDISSGDGLVGLGGLNDISCGAGLVGLADEPGKETSSSAVVWIVTLKLVSTWNQFMRRFYIIL